ncbi:hypothetical protein [Desulfofalx alkaliphila]|uniref:hypothetical protein n=1 Tax=Desulfofalx alkaliphila TaxID=105483 RepID=UPI0004E0E880|nr:hypothetical protein [Desulfofalx alkaliphila]
MAKVIMGIQIDQRTKDAVTVQELLTKAGCSIKTRLGLNQNIASCKAEDSCGNKGLILLEFFNGAEEEIKKLEEDLAKLGSIVVKKMEF